MLKINNKTSELIIFEDIIESIMPSSSREIHSSDEFKWANSNDVLSAIISNDITIERNGVEYTDHNEQIDVLKGNDNLPKTSEGDRLFIATNRIPGGYTQYISGVSDDVANDSYGTGDKLKFSKTNTTITFEQLDHYYMIGAKGFFNSECTLDDEMAAKMVAPGSTGWSDNGSNTGNANKVEIAPSSGLYILVPAPLNDGNVDLDLTEFRSGSTKVLANTPVPQAGNTGYFNYNSDTNEITAVSNPASPDGGYNLYTFDITLHRFAESVYGGPNKVCDFEAADIVGKKLFNFWKIQLTLTPESGTSRDPKVGIIFNLGVKGNVN